MLSDESSVLSEALARLLRLRAEHRYTQVVVLLCLTPTPTDGIESIASRYQVFELLINAGDVTNVISL